MGGGDALVQHVREMRGGDGVRGQEAVREEAVGGPERWRRGAAGEKQEREGRCGGGVVGAGGGRVGGVEVRRVEVQRWPQILAQELDVHVHLVFAVVVLVQTFFFVALVVLCCGAVEDGEMEWDQTWGRAIVAGMRH